jgi:hypothetical protein
VNEKAMQGECRVTVIATGFDKTPTHIAAEAAKEPHLARNANAGTPVIPLRTQSRPVTPQPRPMMNQNDISRRVTPLSPPSSTSDKTDGNAQDLSDMEIPTFIRRQMD